MTRVRKFSPAFARRFLFASLLSIACSALPSLAQTPRPPAFLADHYDITATLDPVAQSLSAVAKIEFKAQEVSGGVRVELHQNLDVREVKSADGKSLSFERDSGNPLFLTVVSAILGAVLGYLMGQLAGVLKSRPGRSDTSARSST